MTSFHEVAISPLFSAIASGGPEWATAIVRSGEGGSIAHRAETREDYISKYEIDYSLLEPARLSELRTFALLRKGMANAFRFLAPDDHKLTLENVGWYNPASGDVEYLSQTPGGNTNSIFYFIRHYSDQANAYTRRIVKPSPFDDLVISVNGSTVATILKNTVLGPFGTIPQTSFGSFSLGGTHHFTIDWWQGKLMFAAPPPAGWVIKVSGAYHVPVTFADDWQKFMVDEVGLSEFKVGLEEVLPIELGLAPTSGPATPTGFGVQSTPAGGVTLQWNAVAGAAGYEVLVDESVVFVAGNVTQYTVGGLGSGTSHRFRVRAYDVAAPVQNRSAWSAFVDATAG